MEEKDEAIRLHKAYLQLGKHYDLLECIDVTLEDQPCSGKLIGYDVADVNGYSAIVQYNYLNEGDRRPRQDKAVTLLLHKYFSTRLNQYGLLDMWEDALLLREVELFVKDHIPEYDFLHIDEETLRVFKLSIIHD